MSLLSVLERVAEHTPEPFIAPIPQANTVDIFSVQSDIPYKFTLQNARSGWWNVLPRSKIHAGLGTRIWPHEKFSYLAQLPRFYVIAIAQVNATTWLVTPFNIADAAQRGWKNGEPKQIFLTGYIEQFDVVVARKLDQILLYEGHNTRIATFAREYIDNHQYDNFVGKDKSFNHALNIIRAIRAQEKQRELEEEKRLREHAQQKKLQEFSKNAKSYAEHQLQMVGAELQDFSKIDDGYEITWEFDGVRFTVPVFDNLQVQSAGICLAGTDSFHSLPMIVQTMQDARVKNRYDLNEEYWL